MSITIVLHTEKGIHDGTHEDAAACMLVDGVTPQELRGALLRSRRCRSTGMRARHIWIPDHYLVHGNHNVTNETSVDSEEYTRNLHGAFFPGGINTADLTRTIVTAYARHLIAHVPLYEIETRMRSSLTTMQRVTKKDVTDFKKYQYRTAALNRTLMEVWKGRESAELKQFGLKSFMDKDDFTARPTWRRMACAVVRHCDADTVRETLLSGRILRLSQAQVWVLSQFILAGSRTHEPNMVGGCAAGSHQIVGDMLILAMRVIARHMEWNAIARLSAKPQAVRSADMVLFSNSMLQSMADYGSKVVRPIEAALREEIAWLKENRLVAVTG